MNNAEEILNSLFDEIGLDRDVKRIRDTNADKDYKSKWPLYEIKGTHGRTFDVCETLDHAKAIVKNARLKRWEIWQINQSGQKVLMEQSHNEAGFVRNNAFDKLKGLKNARAA